MKLKLKAALKVCSLVLYLEPQKLRRGNTIPPPHVHGRNLKNTLITIRAEIGRDGDRSKFWETSVPEFTYIIRTLEKCPARSVDDRNMCK